MNKNYMALNTYMRNQIKWYLLHPKLWIIDSDSDSYSNNNSNNSK